LNYQIIAGHISGNGLTVQKVVKFVKVLKRTDYRPVEIFNA
jgi:hypothetical protein